MEYKDNLDRFLDRALDDFNRATPREGLEQRIQSNLAAREEGRRWRWHSLWVAAPVMAVVLWALLFGPMMVKERTAPITDAHREAAPVLQPTLSPAIPPPKQPTITRIRRQPTVRSEVIANVKPEPRLATFPSADDGEQQARMLLQFVSGHPEQAKKVVREEQEFQQIAEGMMNRGSEGRSERER